METRDDLIERHRLETWMWKDRAEDYRKKWERQCEVAGKLLADLTAAKRRIKELEA